LLLLLCCCLRWPLLEPLEPLGPLEPSDPLGLLVLGRRASCLVRAE
jgi:hypothetical protein